MCDAPPSLSKRCKRQASGTSCRAGQITFHQGGTAVSLTWQQEAWTELRIVGIVSVSCLWNFWFRFSHRNITCQISLIQLPELWQPSNLLGWTCRSPQRFRHRPPPSPRKWQPHSTARPTTNTHLPTSRSLVSWGARKIDEQLHVGHGFERCELRA